MFSRKNPRTESTGNTPTGPEAPGASPTPGALPAWALALLGRGAVVASVGLTGAAAFSATVPVPWGVLAVMLAATSGAGYVVGAAVNTPPGEPTGGLQSHQDAPTGPEGPEAGAGQ